MALLAPFGEERRRYAVARRLTPRLRDAASLALLLLLALSPLALHLWRLLR